MWSVIIILVLLIPLLAVVLDSAPARALANRLEREGESPSGALDKRLAALESEIERLNREIDRLGEEGQFMQRLIEGRGPAERLEPPHEGSAGPPASERRE